MRVTYQATRPDGTEVHATLGALDLAEARSVLEQRGYRDIRFTLEPMPDLDRHGAEEKVLVKPGLPLWRVLAPNTAVAVGVLGWSVWSLTRGEGVFWNLTWMVITILLWTLVVAPAAVYPALRADKAWGRWEAMRRKAQFLRLTSWVLRQRLVRVTVDFELARSLAGLGRLSEALALVAPHANGPAAERAFYLGQLVSVYEIAGDFDAALRVAREHAGLAPTEASPRLDLAMRYALRFHDPESARAELDQIRQTELSRIAEGFREYVLGVVLLEEGSFGDAHACLDRALVLMGPLPLMESLLAGVRAHRAWAKAGLGRFDESQRELQEVHAMVAAGDRWVAAHIDDRIGALRRNNTFRS